MTAVLLNKLHSIFQVFLYSDGLSQHRHICVIFQNFLFALFFLFFILSLASHLQQNKQCLSAYVGSNLAVPMVSELSDAMCTAFLFGSLCCIL